MRGGARPAWEGRLRLLVMDRWVDFLIRVEERRGRDLPEWVWNVQDAVEEAVKTVLCLVFGHRPTRDVCGRPEHDHCVSCGKPLPFAAGGEKRSSGGWS